LSALSDSLINIRIDPHASEVLVYGKATGHQFKTRFFHLEGVLKVDSDEPEKSAEALFSLEMGKVDGGDFLRTRQIKSYLNPRKFPTATFTLHRLELSPESDIQGALHRCEESELKIFGGLAYRNRNLEFSTTAKGTIDPKGILVATCRFSMDIRELGMEPPSFLFIKVRPEVDIEVRLIGKRKGS